ncbi:MAG: DUF2794 domain-containing protein [Sphingomonadales bacterium]
MERLCGVSLPELGRNHGIRTCLRFAAFPAARAGAVFFDRRELALILNLYATRVAAGEWCDYAIGHDGRTAVFSIYRSTSRAPRYRIVKNARQRPGRGAYSVISASGQILRVGQTLAQALKIFEPSRLSLVDIH